MKKEDLENLDVEILKDYLTTLVGIDEGLKQYIKEKKEINNEK